jgi:hypothetical protein
MNTRQQSIEHLQSGLQQAIEIRSNVQTLININRVKLDDLYFESEFYVDHEREIEEIELFIAETTALLAQIDGLITRIRGYIEDLSNI